MSYDLEDACTSTQHELLIVTNKKNIIFSIFIQSTGIREVQHASKVRILEL